MNRYPTRVAPSRVGLVACAATLIHTTVHRWWPIAAGSVCRRWTCLFWFILAMVVGRSGSAHDERDVVCGMMVPIESARFSTTFGGRLYHFCSEADLDLFLAKPEEYVKGLRLAKTLGAFEWSLLMEARAGGAVHCLVTAKRSGAPVDVANATVMLLRVDRSRAPQPEHYVLHPLAGGQVGFQFLRNEISEYRLGFTLPESKSSQRVFLTADLPITDFPLPFDTRGNQGRIEASVADANAPLAMGRQHESMRIIGREWAATGHALLEGPAPPAALVPSMRRIRTEMKLATQFQLHHFADDANELALLATSADPALRDLENALVRNDRDSAIAHYQSIDAKVCTTCHLKFRYGIVDDLTTLPPLAMPSETVPTPRVLDAPPRQDRRGPLVGDPSNGKRLYELACVTCHGWSGAGDGPARVLLRPAPRNHRDGAWMNARSNEELHRVIAEGGGALERSPLMPAFGDMLDELDIWDLVAYLRTLHASPDGLFAEPAILILRETLLDTKGFAPFARPIARDDMQPYSSYLEVRRRLPGQEAEEQTKNMQPADLLGYVAFSKVEEGARRTDIVIAADPKGQIIAARLSPPLELQTRAGRVDLGEVLRESLGLQSTKTSSAPASPPASTIAQQVRDRSQRLAARLREAIEQRRVDVTEAEDVYRRFQLNPESFPQPAAFFQRACSPCHGTTGRGVGPNLREKPLPGAMIADGERLNDVPEDFLVRLIREGGTPTYVSATMPAFGLPETEARALVRYLRSLAVPQPGDGCLCGVKASPCQHAGTDAWGCRCVSDLGKSCPHIVHGNG